MKTLKEIRSIQEAMKEITIPWDFGDPKKFQRDMEGKRVYLTKWNKQKSEIVIDGDEKDLIDWLVYEYGMDKKEAQTVIKKGKRTK